MAEQTAMMSNSLNPLELVLSASIVVQFVMALLLLASLVSWSIMLRKRAELRKARTEWLRAAGIEQLPLKDQHGLMFVVVDLEAQYRKPARYGDELMVTCEIAERTRASFTFQQQVYRGSLDGELLVEGKVRVACLDAVNLRPTALPKELMRSDRE